MKFGPVPVDQALGAILAHSMDGINAAGKPVRLRKGSRLGDGEIAALTAAGHARIIVAQLAETDVHEDVAATRLASGLVPDPGGSGLRLSRAATGRVNVFATAPGILDIDTGALTAFNRIDPMITIATVPQYRRLAPDEMAATIKIIAYAVPEPAVVAGEAIGAALRLLTPHYARATLIETTFDPETPLSDKGRRAMQLRLDRLGVDLTARVIVRHDASAIAEAIAGAPGEVVLILTASATSDPRDVAPEAVRQAGGTITRFGMPVDPGNLLFLGDFGEKPVIGLPGCARSPVLNGADWILERVICGVAVSHDDIAALGVGGLLKESPARHYPRRGRTAAD